jgi:glycosyltransferase involved in cell wall biosynthesis
MMEETDTYIIDKYETYETYDFKSSYAPVSVIIPTYESHGLIKRAIKSVVNQDYYGKIEIIVVDDSKERLSTSEISSLLTKNNVSIIYIHSKSRFGVQKARDFGIKNASSELLAFLDDDDEWLETKVSKQVNQLTNNIGASISVTWSEDHRFSMKRISSPKSIVSHKELLKSFNISSTSTYMTRKSLLEKIKENGYYFDPRLKSGQEYDLAIRLSNYGDVLCVQEVLTIQNSREGQISRNWKNKISGTLLLYSKHHSEFSLLSHLKTVGLITVFYFGYFFGDRIYKLLTPMKKIYESRA